MNDRDWMMLKKLADPDNYTYLDTIFGPYYGWDADEKPLPWEIAQKILDNQEKV